MRGKTLDIKEHKKWKYENNLCVGCGEKSESEIELLTCPGLCERKEENSENLSYSLVFGDNLIIFDHVRI